MSSKHYLTTPIYYSNSNPHIGHLYTGLICDFWRESNKIFDSNVYLSSGMDEHGQKVYQSAISKNYSPQEYVDIINNNFKSFFEKYHIRYDYWIRTTDTNHEKVAQYFWQKLKNNGYIYKSRYEGWYSISDENYLDVSKDYVSTSPSIVWREEECYYFKLSAFEEKLLSYYKKNKDTVFPKTRYNETIGFIKQGLKDFSISRPKDRLNWGIEIPEDPTQVMYVWIDALVNYLTVAGYPDEKYKEYWPGIHVIGKDILKFHAIYWPALLMAADVELPKQVIVHGWWLNGDQKVSKSLNNAIDIDSLRESYGGDSLRYFFLSNMKLGEDANFKESTFSVCFNSILSNKYGNLFLRLLGMANNHKYEKLSVYKIDKIFDENIQLLIEKAQNFVKNIANFDDFIDFFVDFLDFLNNYINENQIWKKTGNELEKELYSLLYSFKLVSVIYAGSFPETSLKIAKYFDIDLKFSSAIEHKEILIKESVVLFPKK